MRSAHSTWLSLPVNERVDNSGYRVTAPPSSSHALIRPFIALPPNAIRLGTLLTTRLHVLSIPFEPDSSVDLSSQRVAVSVRATPQGDYE